MPYNVETDVSLSWGEGGQAQLWGRFEYVVNFAARSPRWQLVPQLEFALHSDDDPARGIGSGLSTLELGLRLHRQLTPGFSPYAGVSWEGRFGDTKDFARAAGDGSELRWLVGLSTWF